MKIQENNFLIKTDQLLDYIPVASTANNLIDLFLKCVFIPVIFGRHKAQTFDNKYITHLQEKSILRCFTLLIPVIGNIIIATMNSLVDPLSVEDFENTKSELKKDPMALKWAHPSFQDRLEIVQSAVLQNPFAYFHASMRLKNNDLLAKDVLKQEPRILSNIGIKLLDNRDFLLRLIRENPKIMYYVHKIKFPCFARHLLSDKEAVKIAVEKDPLIYLLARNKVKKNIELALDVIKTHPEFLPYLDFSLLNNINFLKRAVRLNPDILFHAKYKLGKKCFARQMFSNVEFMKYAIDIYPKVYELMDEDLKKDPILTHLAVSRDITILDRIQK